MNASEASVRIVDFIAALIPAYTYEDLEGRSCARCLLDGTLIIPCFDAPEDGDPWVIVHWQGDPERSSRILAILMASVAVSRYIDLHSPSSDQGRRELDHLANHFTFKTGNGLVFEPSVGNVVETILRKAALLVGREGLLAIIRGHFGF